MSGSALGDMGGNPITTNLTLQILQNLAGMFAIDASLTGALNVGITGGMAIVPPAVSATPIVGVVFNLPDNTPLLIVVVTSLGALALRVATVNIGDFPIWQFATSAGNVISASDLRANTGMSYNLTVVGTGAPVIVQAYADDVGTANAKAASYTVSNPVLTDGALLDLGVAVTNTTTTPTFNPTLNGVALGAVIIKKGVNNALVALALADMVGVCNLRYDLPNLAWVLENPPARSGAFDTGTRMSFNQTASPIGWTKDITAALNDTAMRIVTGVVGSGGANAFAGANYTPTGTTTGTTDGHVLTVAESPDHVHIQQIGYGLSGVAPLGTQYTAGNSTTKAGAVTNGNTIASGTVVTTLGMGGGSAAHSHTISGQPLALANFALSIKYNDFIIATKN